ncbi:MAG: pirin family protein, partial [Myxococcales bacterium]|nr:pirin family protein [Myxococcales bacterium]
EDMGPSASLAGRRIGMDFEGKDGWSMYHGDVVPGFPRHPHRGFETITIARRGFIDHADSLGATARFGKGDVQWMTAGNGVVHSEMFPLLNRDGGNTTELFQIWLNLPREDKTKDAYFTMFWNEEIPRKTFESDSGSAVVTVIAGKFADEEPLSPPPSSWASKPESNVAVWTLAMEGAATVALPPADQSVNRVLYVFGGKALRVGDVPIESGTAAQLSPGVEVQVSSTEGGEALLLQGKPIGEPVVQQGPFVVNYPGEIRQTMLDYQQTGFGGWKWQSDGPVHPRDAGRFAIHADGNRETPDQRSR